MLDGRGTRAPLFLSLLAAVVVAVLPLAGCGGGGSGGGSKKKVPVLDLGAVAVAAPTRVEQEFDNPLGRAATVTVVRTRGRFTIDPDDLPGTCGAGAPAILGVICDPVETGETTGAVTLRFRAGSRTRTVRWKLEAWSEPPEWELLTPDLDFGSILVGDAADVAVRIRNKSVASPILIDGVDLPSAEFQVVGAGLPLGIPAGETGEIVVRFTPTAEGAFDGTLVVGRGDRGGPVSVTLRAQARIIGAEVIVDFGTQTLDAAGRTPVLSVNVPFDAYSVSFEGRCNANDVLGLDTLTGPGGFVYENAASTGRYMWGAKVIAWVPPPAEAFLATIPNTDDPTLQLVPGGGTYTFSLIRTTGTSTTMDVRVIVERRATEIANAGILDLNVFLAPGIGVTAEDAASEEDLQKILSEADQILRTQGIRLGDIAYYDLGDSSWNYISVSILPQLMMESSAAAEERMNVFLVMGVQDAIGYASAIPGPKWNGTALSGVACRYVTEPYALVSGGVVVAHEICHHLGLWHVTELSGVQDIILDTPQYSANLMGVGGGSSSLTNGQGLVMRAHPHVRFDPDARAKALRVSRPSADRASQAFSHPAGWCATCGPHGK